MFKGNPTVIDGIEIPYDGKLFLIVITIHVAGGLICVISGIFAMLSNKRKGVHTVAGKIYYCSIWIVFLTAIVIAIDRWKEDYHLFFLGLVSFSAAFVARLAIRKKWKMWSFYHIAGMGISYIFLLIAFYVDNGKFLPLWKEMHPVIYWLLPLVVGIPIILRTFLRNPLTRNYFK